MSTGFGGGGATALGPGTERRILAAVLGINAAMFAIEFTAGWQAQSVSLQADALDFLGDSLNYAVALLVLTRSVLWRAGSALLKGVVMMGFGAYVLVLSVINAAFGSAPHAPVMGAVGTLALAANLFSAFLLFRFRKGEANLRSVWLCSRNDAIGNLAVLVAAGGVLAFGAPWPDILVGVVIAALGLSAGHSVVRQSIAELR